MEDNKPKSRILSFEDFTAQQQGAEEMPAMGHEEMPTGDEMGMENEPAPAEEPNMLGGDETDHNVSTNMMDEPAAGTEAPAGNEPNVELEGPAEPTHVDEEG